MVRAVIVFLAMSCVVVFLGIPGLLLGLIYRSHWVGNTLARTWARAVLLSSGVRLAVVGGENVAGHQALFLVGNHQSAVDIPVLCATMKGALRFMAKGSLFRVPLFGWLLWQHGYAPINRSSARETLRSLEKMRDLLQRKPISFAVFPEGTRSPDGRLLPFRQGTMKICQEVGFPIVPFAIEGSRAIHSRKALRVHPGPVRVTFGRPISPKEAQSMSPADLNQRIMREVAGYLGQPVPMHGGQEDHGSKAEETSPVG
ncbi:MAG: 1-acyl-sn-glycerol-3-phosphate acyltransferase [Phycisphaerales bacterium]|nr:MAG: 1-acyl-sn-glycerol-3-phosphate acyltransferase [Phycisphaerales bacterium]